MITARPLFPWVPSTTEHVHTNDAQISKVQERSGETETHLTTRRSFLAVSAAAASWSYVRLFSTAVHIDRLCITLTVHAITTN